MMEKLGRRIDRIFRRSMDPDFISMLILSLLFAWFCLHQARASDVRTVHLDQSNVARIYVSPGRSTILSFPGKPEKVILGNQGVFAVEYVEDDLAIAALSAHSRSDLFVYLEGRRFAFDLAAVPGGSDTIVLVRDAVEAPPSTMGAKAQRKLKAVKHHPTAKTRAMP